MRVRNRKSIIYLTILLVMIGLSVGFSALQKQLTAHDMGAEVRLQKEVRVSNISVSKVSGNAVSNFEDYNKEKLFGSVTLPSTSSYVLYKVDLTNYGNVKSGLLSITNNGSGTSYSICDSNGSNCTTDPETKICNGSNCTLGTTKEIYVKVSSNTTGTKTVDLDLDFEPYNDITYEYFSENTSSFKSEIMSTDSYSVTFTSKPEEVEVTGEATYNYNKNSGLLEISNVSSALNIRAKYKVNEVAETSYSGSNPNNYVKFNNTLYRIVTKENIDDGYSNTELRTKIVKESSIGNNPFDTTSNEFAESSLKDVLNNTYYGTLDEDAQGLIDTALWTEEYAGYIGLIDSDDYTGNSNWLTMEEFTVTKGEDNKVVIVTSSGLSSSNPNTSKATYPCIYLKKDVLVVDGDGSRNNPYILELSGNGLQTNPTRVLGRNLTVTGSNQDLVTVENKVGTVYYSTSTRLTSENYTNTNISSPNIPTARNTGTYTIYYYIPAGENYKPKSGSVKTTISGLTYTIAYVKGENITSIGKESDSCTTSGSDLTCSVTLPTITPSAGYENGVWKNGSNTYNVGSSFTLNSNNTGLTLTSQVSGKTYVATFYYYDGTSVATETRSCTVSSGSTCNVTVPSGVQNSTGVYGGTYKGVTSTTNSMTLTNTTLSESKSLYAVYQKNVTNYYYNTSTYAERTIYRNEYFTSASALGVKLSTSETGVTNYETAAGVGGSEWTGLSTAQDTTAEYTSVSDAAESTSTTLYTIYTFNVNYEKGVNVASIGATGGTCKVTNQTGCYVMLPSITSNEGYVGVGWNRTSGATTGTGPGQPYQITENNITLYANAKGATYTATFYYYNGTAIATTTAQCTVSSGSNCTVTIPSVVSSSSGVYSSAYKGVASSASTMNEGTLTINNNTTKFYAIYSTPVTRYYYSSGYKNNTIYRNEYFINETTMNAVLTTVDNGTTNYTTSRGPGSSNWIGLSTAQDTTPEYNTVALAAKSTATTLYTVYEFNITYEKSTTVSEIGATSDSCRVTTSDTSCAVILPSITPNTGYTTVGWSTTNGDTTGTAALSVYLLDTNNRVLYANAIAANYQNMTTNESYMTLNEAFAAVSNNQTIKVLQNVTETTAATLASGKTGIKLDLNGKTITTSRIITNNGTLDIYNSSSTNGSIVGSNNRVISNEGTFTINATSSVNKTIITDNSTDAKHYAIYNNASSTVTINSNVKVNSTMIALDNFGTANINNATLSGNDYGITNEISSQLTVTGNNTQISGSEGIRNQGTLTIGTNDSTVSTSGPLVQATGTSNKNGVYNAGTFNFYDGIIKSASGTGKSIYGTVTNVPNGYEIYKSTTSGVESAYLIETISFSGATITKTFSTTAQTQSNAINAATGGSGTFTYSITGGNNNNYFSLSGRNLTIAANTPANTTGYSLTVTATDSTTGLSKTATYIVKINKADVTCTTSKGNYDYNGTIGSPSVSANPGSGTVTYYRNTTNSTSGGTAWSGTTSTTLSPGTYYIYATIASTSNYNGATCSASSFTVSKGTCTAPTNVTIGTDKKVSWTASSTASSYQVCVASGSNTCTPSTTLTSGSAYNAITDATGSRTVYVRSVCNSTNYNTPSSNASASTTVYSVALTKGTGISAVTGAGNYITGASVSIDATVSSGYTWYRWTNTSSGSQLTTTKAYSFTINSNRSYTANATQNSLTFDGSTITKTFSTTAQTQTNAINAASNGSGTYTYAITGGNSNNYFSLDGRNLTIAANTPANTTGYSLTVTATDSNTGAVASATYTIKINKADFTCTTSKGNYAYNGTIGNPSVSSNPGSGTVTYYRNTSNSTSGGTAWSGTTSTTLSPGTYYIYATIGATTNYNGATCSTGSFTVSKGTCTAPTNVAIGTDKKVSWTASSTASSYQVCVANGSNTCTPSTTLTSGSAYNAITDATGTRTVYVRSVCSTTYYSAANSSNASNATTVYSVALTKGTGISAVSGADNYITGASVSIDATVSSGYTWYRWTNTSGGSQVSTTKAYSFTINSNRSYTANATRNSLTFAGGTVTKTFSTSSQTETNAISAASNGSGTYTYAITAGNSNNYFSLSGRNLTIAANTPANTTGYEVTVTATDSNTGATATATYTIVINKATCAAPTNVTIGTDKKVSWTASSTASSYQVCVASGSNTCTPSTTLTSGSAYNAITDATGSRTVYVRSVCNSTNYNTPSSNASKATTVYSVALTKGTGISAVSGAGNYITGASVSIDATVSSGYTWYRWTQTSGGAQLTTTKAYSFTINSNRSYTANATRNSLTFNGATITKTFSTTAQTETNAINVATNGSGTYTYAITSGNSSNYFSLSGRNLTIAANTPANTTGYSLTVTATDSNTGATATATYVVKINKADFTCTASKGNYDYNGTIGNPSVSANPGSGTVTYYRNTSNSTSGGTAWSGTTSTTLSPGTYYIYATIPATKNYNSATCSASSFTVNKGTCTAPTNVTIGTDKKVSWTASSTASSYQVCVASGSNTCTPSTALTSGSVYNAITDATGSRTVYVRSVCNSTNYNTPSSNASKSTTVYSVTLASGTGISAVSGAGNYITGASVSIDATVSSGYTWYRWTQTSGGAQLTTTKAYSFTINSNRSYTANATRNSLTFNGATITKTFSTTAQTQTNAINAATNGSGTYTYEITAGNSNNYFSLDGRNLSIAANTPANTTGYDVTVTATDSNTGATATATYTIKINKADFTCTTSKGNYAYNGTIGSPSVSANPGSGTVTYYRNTSNSTSGGTAWSGTTSTTLSPGTYYIYATIASTTNYNSATCSAGSFTVSKGTCTAPTNVTIGTDKKVSWTASSTASSYQVCVASGSNTCTPSTTLTSGSAYNAITDATGTRTVYVRSVCNSTNYNTPSANASASTTVYSVTLTKGTGISTVSGAGNYITGASVSIDATVSAGYTWSKWTQTSGGSQVSTTKAYSATISGNWAYTANTTVNALTFNGATITKTFSTLSQSQSNAINAATGGSGTYTYAITAGNSNNYFSLDGRNLSIAASTPANTTGYSLTVTATDSNTGATATATYTIKINKADFTCVASMGGYSYNGTIASPVVSNNPGSGTVTYYRNTSNSTSGGTAWSGTTSTTLAPGTYYIYATIGATSNYNSATCDASSFIVSKGTCKAPSNLSISSDKKVSWTNSSTASSYEACATNDGDTCTPNTALSNGSVFNAITDGTGSRRVNVRSVCNSTYYNSPSTNITGTIYVYSVALTKGTGISAVSGAGNYITGATVNIDATVNSGYTWINWTNTSGGSQVTTTKAYTFTINSNRSYTANAFANNYQNTTTNAYYGTLNNAFAAVSNNQTIKVINNTTETTKATLPSGKTGVKLDLNGKTITMSSTYIENNGTLDIYNTSSTDGKIDGGDSKVLENNGTLTLNGTSSTNKVIIDRTTNTNFDGTISNKSSKSLTVNDNIEIKVSEGSSPGIINNGTATITGGTITGSTYGIDNQSSGVLNISGSNTQINGTSRDGIANFGTATISGGIITGSGDGITNSGVQLSVSGNSTQITGTTGNGIYNNGPATISGGTITGSSFGINNRVEKELNISGNNTQIIGLSRSGITNLGTATISGGTITGSTSGIFNDSGTANNIDYHGIVTLNGGTIQGTNSEGIVNSSSCQLEVNGNSVQIISENNQAIFNQGTTIISSGIITGHGGISNQSSGQLEISGSNTQITSTYAYGITNFGTATISGGTITGNTAGIANYKTATITGGTITGTTDSGIVNTSTASVYGSLTLGIVGSSVDINNPLVQTNSTSNKYGVTTCADCTFNFYDGKIVSASGSGKSINGTVTNIPTGYEIHKVISSVGETAYLIKSINITGDTYTKTFSTSEQAIFGGIPAATGGSGVYEYTIVSGNENNYFSLDGRNIIIAASTPVNTSGYGLLVRALDENTGAISTTVVTIIINKANVTCTTSKGNYNYNGTIGSPSVSSNPGSGTVTYYRNTTNSTSGGTAWSGTTSTTLDPGTYYIYAKIAATTNYNAATCSASSFTVNKGTCVAPTNVTIGTDKKVSWTASSTASSYQICVASGSNTCTPSTAHTSGSVYSAITDATGSRTVYVRSVCDSTYYNTPSTNASKATTVYSVTLTKGTGISSVSGAGNYITGATVTLGATASSGYSWSKWTQTSGGTQVSTTNAYSFTINSDRSYTANTTVNSLTFNGSTITKTFSTTAQTQSNAINAATGGSGTYSYTITEGNTNNYFSISGRNLTIAANTPANTTGYSITVRALDDNTGAVATATYTIKINKATFTCTTSKGNYAYNGTIGSPSVSANPGSGTVTYYRNTTNSTSGGTAWSGTTSTTLDPGTYYIYATIPATANYNGATCSASSFTVNKGTCNPPTGVTIGTNKKVSWTASSTASSYQVCVASGSNTCTPSTALTSGSTYSAITDATGSRTVYVRSVCNSTYYNTPSSNASKATTVYSVTLTKGTGISSVSGAGNYITGATVTLGATASSGYSWSKWTQTSGGTDVSTTNAYSAAITSNWAYTANATANQYSITYNVNGGTGIIADTTYNYAPSGTVALTTEVPTYSDTNGDYVFKGWATSSSSKTVDYASGGSFPKSTIGNTTLYAVWARWSNNESPAEHYTTLSSAVSGTTAGKTITLQATYTDTSTVSISKQLTIALSNKTLTRNKTITIASGGDVTVSGTGTLTTSAGVPLTNNGTLTISGGTITSTANVNIITNSNTLNITGGTISQTKAYSAVVNNASTSTVTVTTTVSGGTIKSTSNTLDIPAVENKGKFVMSAGTLSATGQCAGLINDGGTSTISGGTITVADDNAIWVKSGSVTASGGTFTSKSNTYNTISNSGTFTLKGTATATQKGKDNALISKGTTKIQGGTLQKQYQNICSYCNGTQTTNRVVHIDSGTFTMSGGTITYASGYYGGTAITQGGGTATMSGGTLRTYSTETYYGRTVFLSAGSFTITAGTISYQATSNGKAKQVWEYTSGVFHNPNNLSLVVQTGPDP